MRNFLRKRHLAIIMTLAMVISFIPAMMLIASAAIITQISAEPNTPLELSPYTLSGNMDLNPNTNGGTFYMISFSQPVCGAQTAQLYFVNQNDLTYDAQYTDIGNADVIYFKAQQIGNYTFTITLEDVDMIEPTITRTITVEVSESNVSPAFVGTTTSLTVDQDAAATDIKGLLHASDSDADQTLTWTQSTAPTHGVLSFVSATASGGSTDITPGGTITYQPTAGYVGSDSFAVQVSDGTASATRTINVTVDDTAVPTISSVSPPTNNTYRIGDNLDYTVNFSEAVTVSGSPYLTLTIGSSTVQASYNSGSGTSALKFRYTVVSSDSDADGVALSSNISLNSSTIKDAANNSATLTFTGAIAAGVLVDGVAPTVSISSTVPSLTNTSPIPVTITFSESVTGFTADDITVSNGSKGTLSGSGTTYSINITPSAQGAVTVDIAGSVAQDTAGNNNTAASQLSRTYDSVVPTVTLTSTAASCTNTSPIPVTITFSESVSGFTADDITVSNGSKGTLSGSGASYSINITPSAQGAVTVDIAGSVAIDAAGNNNTAASQLSRTYDSVAPTVTLTSTAASYTNTSPIPVTITFSESVSSFTADDITVGNGSKGTLSGSGSSYSINITPNAQGEVTVDIAGSVATDAAGNNNTAATQLSRTYDSVAPTAPTVISAAASTNDSTPEWTWTAGDGGNGTYRYKLDNSTLTSEATETTTASYTPTSALSSSSHTLYVQERDQAGNWSTSGSYSITIDCTAPTVSISSTAASCTNTSPIPVTITFSESVTGFTADDITVSNGSKGTLSGSGTAYSINITPSTQGAVTVDIAGSVAIDAAGNNNTAASQLSRTYDSVAPTVSISSTAASYTNTSPIPVTITFSESVTGFTADDITIGNGSKGTLSGSGASYSINITPSAQGAVTVDIAGSVATDAAGNNNTAATQLSRTYDSTSPVAGGTATITVGTVTASAASLSWSAATDNLAPQANLQYQVYYSTSNNIGTLSDVENNGTAFGDWTKNITTTTVTGLTAATEYYFNIITKDEAGNKSIYTTATATTASARSHRGDSSNQTSSPGSTVVEVNGQRQDVGQISTRTTGGTTISTVTVDDKKLGKILEQKGNNAIVTLNVSTKADIVVGELNGQTVKNMEAKNATLEIKTETVTYTLPASQININAISSQFGSQVDLKDIKISIEISESPKDAVKIVRDTATENNYQIVVQPIEFTITCTNGDKTIEISRFNSFVERTVAIPEGINPSNITTAIVLNADKTFRQVPTQIVIINGKYYARINSLTNSTYSVIYNSVTFTDMADHWAKDAVNDMGARMIVTGTGNNTYEPNRTINRAEFAAIIVRAIGLEQSYTESSFDDVTLTDWFNGYVDTANAYALITGYDSIRFGPNDLITREQAIAIIARTMNLTGIGKSLTDSEINAILAPYTDSAKVSGYARESTAACLKTGIVNGTTASTISPKAYVTRAEVAVMVQRLLQKSALI